MPLQAALKQRRDACELESQPAYELNVTRVGYGPIPQAEVRIAHTGVEGSATPTLSRTVKRVPVPDVKELAAQLEVHLFLNSKVLDDGYVVIVVTEAPVPFAVERTGMDYVQVPSESLSLVRIPKRR